MITVRRANTFDAPSMADLLNAIIKKGGTTAILRPMTGDDIRKRMAFAPEQSAWNVALDKAEKVVGFQWIAPTDYLPPEACDIASFVEIGRTGLGIGSSLFDATKQAAKELGYVWINANIRADNESGLTYYQSRGFRDWKFDEGVELADGMIVDKIHKRYEI